MKILLLLCLLVCFACTLLKAQSRRPGPGNTPQKQLPRNVYGPQSLLAVTFMQKTGADSLGSVVYNNQYYLQKSRVQRINGLVLMAGGSVIGAFGMRNNSIYPGSSATKDPLSANEIREQRTLGITSLVMMAGSISYFVSSLINRNKAGLKLTSQKTSFGSSNKACKKVTSLTFAIPIGK